MNHYAVKSVDSYAVRKFRGNVNNKKDKYNADYWSLQDRNEVEDRAILRHAPDRARIMAELLKDPVLNRLHHAALERVEARLAEYRQTDAYQQLRESLIKASEVPITQVEAKPPQARESPPRSPPWNERSRKEIPIPPKEERAPKPSPAGPPKAATPHIGRPPIDLSAEIANEWVPQPRDRAARRRPRLPPPKRSPPSSPAASNAAMRGNNRRLPRRLPPRAGNRRGVGFLPIRIIQVSQGVRGHGAGHAPRTDRARAGDRAPPPYRQLRPPEMDRWPPPLAPVTRGAGGQRPPGLPARFPPHRAAPQPACRCAPETLAAQDLGTVTRVRRPLRSPTNRPPNGARATPPSSPPRASPKTKTAPARGSLQIATSRPP